MNVVTDNYCFNVELLAFSLRHLELRSVEELPPPLAQQERENAKTLTLSSFWSGVNSQNSSSLSLNGTPTTTHSNSHAAGMQTTRSSSPAQQKSVESKRTSTLGTNRVGNRQPVDVNVTAPSAAAPEFEDRNEQDEGGKGEEDPDANVDNGGNAAPPADDVAAGEGIAKEDTEPVKGKDKEENQLGAMVEDAKGNAPAPTTVNKFPTAIDLEQAEDSHFMTFIVVGGLLVFCLYLLHHNKKKILGLVFEGRAAGTSRRKVRYRRLSQRDDHEALKDNVVY